MTPKEFLNHYRFDDRMVTGQYYSQEPLQIEPGDTVGVVLFNLGGPRSTEEIEPFLYNLFMDPAIIDIPIPGFLRHPLCRFVSKRRARSVSEEYGLIGGASPINEHTDRQAQALEHELNERHGQRLDATFRVYKAMRYADPSTEEAARKMKEDGVDKVLLLPLYPQYSKTTTGASLVYWSVLEQRGEIERRPTTAVFEYATHPSFVAAISTRIDEGLQRFPEEVRDSVHLLFSAHGTPVKEMTERHDPYCCLIHSTVDRVMALRENDRPFDVAFQSKVGPAEWLTPATPDRLEELAEEGHTAVLVIPVAFVSDHVETVFELNIEVREEAEAAGIQHFEVTEGLNDHPLFIDALVDVSARHLRKAGVTSDWAPEPVPPADRCTACHQCRRVTEAVQWTRVSVSEA